MPTRHTDPKQGLLCRDLPMTRRPIRTGLLAGGVALGANIWLSACAPAMAPPSAQAANSAGTIVAMRPLALRPIEPAGAEADGLQGLAMAASSPAGSEPGSGQDLGPKMDFIVRVAGGGTIAVVQTNELGFRVGDGVVIVHSDRTRLSRPGA